MVEWFCHVANMFFQGLSDTAFFFRTNYDIFIIKKLQHENCSIFIIKKLWWVSGKIPPGRKATRKKAPEKMAPWKITPENMTPRKFALGKLPPGKMPPRKIAPRKIVLLDFCWFWHYLTVVPFKTCYSFRDVSRTPATSIIDLLVTVVNSINYCPKKLLFRCCGGRRFASELIRWSFSKIFISKAHSSASDTR